MKTTSLVFLVLLAAAIATGAQSPVAAGSSFTGFPIYPHATTIWPGSASVPGYVLKSKDSMATIDRWYRSKLPETCQRSMLAAHGVTSIQYVCRGTPRAILDIVPDQGQVDIHAQPV